MPTQMFDLGIIEVEKGLYDHIWCLVLKPLADDLAMLTWDVIIDDSTGDFVDA